MLAILKQSVGAVLTAGGRLNRVTVGLLVYLLALSAIAADGTADPLDQLLAGEFALQQGQTAEAARHYAEAALASRDPRLAERAAKLGLVAKQPELAQQVYRHWRKLEGRSTALAQFELSLAMQHADEALARRATEHLLEQPDGWRRVLSSVLADPRGLVARAVVTQLAEHESVTRDLEALLAVGGVADRLELEGVTERIGELAVNAFPERARAWLWRAEVARKRAHESLALSSVRQALTLQDLSPDLRMAAAALLAMLGQPKDAADALAEGPQTDSVWASRAAYLARSEDVAAIEAFIVELAGDAPGDLPANKRYVLGQLAELLKKPDEAKAWYQGVDAGEQLASAKLRLAVLAEQAGDLVEAQGILHSLQESESDDGRALIDAFLLEAELLIKHAELAAALQVYERGLQRFEDDGGLLYARALLHERMDRIDLAEADFRQMLMADPGNSDVLNALGYTLADRTDRFDEAFEFIRQALDAQPDNPAILDSMGWVLFRQGKVDEALPYLQRAFEMQRDAEVAAHLGEALWALDREDEARSIWRLGREIDAENRALKRVLDRLAPEL